MRRNLLIGVVVLCLAVLVVGVPRFACGRGSPDIGQPGPLPVRGSGDAGSPEARALAQSLSTFGFDLLVRQAGRTGENVNTSPASLASVLSMIRTGARAETEAELASALGVAGLDPASVNQGWADLITAAQSGKKTSVTIWSSLWLRDGIQFEPAFLEVNREYYAADCLSLDKSDSAAVKEINDWAAERTSGKLPPLFQDLDPGTYLVVVNTVNLKVGWELFNRLRTKSERFRTGDGTMVDVPMMHGTLHSDGETRTAIFGEGDFDAVRLATDGPVDVWVIVPTGEKTPEEVARKLAEGGGMPALYEQTGGWDVELALPRFEITYQPDDGELMTNLRDMGIERLFDRDLAQLGGIAKVPPPFYVTDIAHSARIKVDEEGVEAQAASGAQAGCGSGGPVSIRADRPFLVVLTESASQAPLFLTIVRDPRTPTG